MANRVDAGSVRHGDVAVASPVVALIGRVVGFGLCGPGRARPKLLLSLAEIVAQCGGFPGLAGAAVGLGLRGQCGAARRFGHRRDFLRSGGAILYPMLTFALVTLAITVVLGMILVGLVMRGEAGPRLPAWPGIVHGGAGILGFVILLLALGRGPPRGVAQGGGGFGALAAWLIGAALVAAALMVRAHLRRQKPAPVVVALHATIAVAGFVMLFAYANLPP
jgi:hypothetical protein